MMKFNLSKEPYFVRQMVKEFERNNRMSDICGNTGRPCSKCQPGACSFRVEKRATIEQLLKHCDRFCEKEKLYGNVHGIRYIEHDSVRAYLQELQKYKDLEEAGRLIVMPCATSDEKEFQAIITMVSKNDSKAFILLDATETTFKAADDFIRKIFKLSTEESKLEELKENNG